MSKPLGILSITPYPIPTSLCIVGITDGKEVIKDFYVPERTDIDLSDEKIKPYYGKESLGDLSSAKWNCFFINELA